MTSDIHEELRRQGKITSEVRRYIEENNVLNRMIIIPYKTILLVGLLVFGNVLSTGKVGVTAGDFLNRCIAFIVDPRFTVLVAKLAMAALAIFIVKTENSTLLHICALAVCAMFFTLLVLMFPDLFGFLGKILSAVPEVLGFVYEKCKTAMDYTVTPLVDFFEFCIR